MYKDSKVFYRDFGKVMKEKRLRLGMKQSDVAKKLGVTQSYVSCWELGKRRIDLATTIELSLIYKTNLINEVAIVKYKG